MPRLGAVVVCLCAGPTLAESISGVCPDGSIFIVQSASAIPCEEARRVEPEHVPPIKPQYLPRPYAWEVFQSRQDPNNPYNLVGSGRAAGERPVPPAPTEPAGAPPRPAAAPPPEAGAAPQVTAAAPALPGAPTLPRRATPPVALALGSDEIRDLVAIVELSQQRSPAMLVEPDAREPEILLRLARSSAFEARLRDAFAAAGQPVAAGPVLVFAAEALAPYAFYANLTFAQGHVAYHPDPQDRREIGILRGRQGDLAAGELALGYVVLPEGSDLAEPMDVYWNDRRITAVFAPGGDGV